MKAISISELDSLSKIDLRIPRYVQAGDSADLVCSYYLDSHNLYSVKWYKGRHEFYRFMPQETPQVKVFPVKGMKINVSILHFWYYLMTYNQCFWKTWDFPSMIDSLWFYKNHKQMLFMHIAHASCTILLLCIMIHKYLFNISWPCTINLTLFCFGEVQKTFQNQAIPNN